MRIYINLWLSCWSTRPFSSCLPWLPRLTTFLWLLWFLCYHIILVTKITSVPAASMITLVAKVINVPMVSMVTRKRRAFSALRTTFYLIKNSKSYSSLTVENRTEVYMTLLTLNMPSHRLQKLWPFLLSHSVKRQYYNNCRFPLHIKILQQRYGK